MNIILTIICITLLTMLIVNWRVNISDRAFQKEARKKAINHLQKNIDEQQRELELLLNAFDDALLIVDHKKVIKLANRAANTICRGRKLRGKTIVQAFLNDTISAAVKNAVDSKKPVREKIILRTGSFGANKEYDESAWIFDVAPLQVAGQDQLTRIILREITSEHKTDQIKREFVANASHELRTPLAIINGYVENLLYDDVLEQPEIAKKFLKTMHKHGTRLSELVEDMLSVSKLESGDTTTLDVSEFEIKEIFEDIIERLMPMAQPNESALKINLRDKDLKITGDRFYWEQILFNLTENALKQNAHQKISVKLKAKEVAEHVEISVTDNGKGIPAAHLPFIFNRFYRVQKHHSQNQIKGTGLGLSIVKHAVEAHQGKISVTSSPGYSTVFTIRIPNSPNPERVDVQETKELTT